MEAGNRCYDDRVPEEINRRVTDAISDLLFTPSPDGDENLLREGVDASRIHRVGNIMIDSYEMMRPAIEADGTRASIGLQPGGYAVVTLHRPSNVDRSETLEPLVRQLVEVSRRLPLVFAVHPRTRKKLEEFGLLETLAASGSGEPGGRGRILLTEPLGYIQFMNLVGAARAVITDSGGVQEEVSVYKRPLIVVRRSTERPEVLGTFARLVDPGPGISQIAVEWLERLDDVHADLAGMPSPYGDETAPRRSVDAIEALVDG